MASQRQNTAFLIEGFYHLISDNHEVPGSTPGASTRIQKTRF